MRRIGNAAARPQRSPGGRPPGHPYRDLSSEKTPHPRRILRILPLPALSCSLTNTRRPRGISERIAVAPDHFGCRIGRRSLPFSHPSGSRLAAFRPRSEHCGAPSRLRRGTRKTSVPCRVQTASMAGPWMRPVHGITYLMTLRWSGVHTAMTHDTGERRKAERHEEHTQKEGGTQQPTNHTWWSEPTGLHGSAVASRRSR